MNVLLAALGLGFGVGAVFVALLMIPICVDKLKERRRHALIQKPLLADPPWENPRTTDNSAGGLVFRRLLERLSLIDDRSTDEWDGLSIYWRDEQTGQIWHQVFREYGFNEVEELIPVERVPPAP